MDRALAYRRLQSHSSPWDIIVIGGGATGVGIAIDAANRGYEVLLLERSDFGKGTSSRSTKLIHGGVRYLEQGNLSLVMEALKERGLLLKNAPHLVHDLGFVVPNYDWWEAPFYGMGLKIYNLLAGKYGFGASHLLSREETLERLPTINTDGLRGGVVYYDGQFDDSRLLIHMAMTAFELGATLLNYVNVTDFLRGADGLIDGVVAEDAETHEEMRLEAKIVINATGAFSDALRKKADPAIDPIIAPSQGIHLVFDKSFLPGASAIMVPHTSDGRVLFAIPWHDHTIIGTTDTPLPAPVVEPMAQEEEIEFILSTAAEYLAKKPARADVLSVFVGVRPLVRSGHGANTSALSRDHTIQIERSGMLTICGGKWTTYRHMAEDCVNQAATLARLPEKPCATADLNIHGFHSAAEKFGSLSVYGSDAPAIEALAASEPQWSEPLHPDLPYTGAEVVWHTRVEMARTVEDVLARRTRALFLNARAALAMAPRVAHLMAAELDRDRSWEDGQIRELEAISGHYLIH